MQYIFLYILQYGLHAQTSGQLVQSLEVGVPVLLGGQTPAGTSTAYDTGVRAAICAAEGALAVNSIPGQTGGAVCAPVVVADLVAAHGVERVPALWARVDRGPEVDNKREHVEGEDEGDDPLEYGGEVVVARDVHDAEDDDEGELEDDEDELDPEGQAQGAVLSVFLAQALVLCANEDRGEPVPPDEAGEEDVVEPLVVVRVEARQAAQPDGADDGEDHAQPREDLLGQAGVGGEAALVAQPAVGEEAEVEEHGGEDGADDEPRLHGGRGADVRDVGDALLARRRWLQHRGEDGIVRRDDPVEQEAEQRGKPECGGYHGEYLGIVNRHVMSRAWSEVWTYPI